MDLKPEADMRSLPQPISSICTQFRRLLYRSPLTPFFSGKVYRFFIGKIFKKKLGHLPQHINVLSYSLPTKWRLSLPDFKLAEPYPRKPTLYLEAKTSPVRPARYQTYISMAEPASADVAAADQGSAGVPPTLPPPPLSKSAQKKLQKQERYAAKKAERKAQEKARRREDGERKRREWGEKLAAAASEEEREMMLESRKEMRRERMDQKSEERGLKVERLRRAAEVGQKIVVDLEFGDLMTSTQIHSLVQQVTYCYSVNGRCASPAHLWLTGCQGEIGSQLRKVSGFDKWIIEKESKSYIDALQNQKENLVYLTADADNLLEGLDPNKIYIIGGLVDRNRWKGITMKKAKEQGIQSAKLPIGSYLKMSSSQVLTVNQVVEILLRYLETRDWQKAFFQVIPQRKRIEADGENEDADRKRKCVEEIKNGSGSNTE